MNQRPDLNAIAGLQWKEHWRVSNGGNSFVIPFPRLRPMNIVYHGTAKFAYGHFGIHLGQQDCLTFLGDPSKIISATFIDCRASSATARSMLKVQFSPSSQWELQIPPGVAHDFEGLENVTSLNNYKLFLPDPQDWLSGDTKWDAGADVINIASDSDPKSVELFKVNSHAASDVYYAIVIDRQRAALASTGLTYPYTHEHIAEDGTIYILKIHERATTQSSSGAEWEAISDIPGLGWRGNPSLSSGPFSGFVPLLDRRPYYVVDHGFKDEYTHDAYGIHLGQQDCLIFFGQDTAQASVEFVDCRSSSPTLHKVVGATFKPDARRTLVIPNGVAHRFEKMEGIFTLNQGEIFLDDSRPYEPGNDVLDWPKTHRPFPTLTPNRIPADLGYYADLAASQIALLERGERRSTPIVLLAKDSSGNNVRVAIRQSA